MRRETVNRIRYALEELVPPFVRDSRLMRWLFRLYWGRLVDDLEQFRARIYRISAEEYRQVYESMPRIQEATDNSRECLEEIVRRVLPGRICDVGCGTGFLLEFLRSQGVANDSECTGVDFLIEPQVHRDHPGIRFLSAPIERLPFPDRHFDTVICTHVLEHILDIRAAIAELRRITGRRLIIVVPLEREYRFTFNPHVHFFAYPHSFLRYAIPVPESHFVRIIGRDLLYVEDCVPIPIRAS